MKFFIFLCCMLITQVLVLRRVPLRDLLTFKKVHISWRLNRIFSGAGVYWQDNSHHNLLKNGLSSTPNKRSPRVSKWRSWRTFLIENIVANILNGLQQVGAPLMCPCINHTWVADAGKTTKLTDPETDVSERKKGWSSGFARLCFRFICSTSAS